MDFKIVDVFDYHSHLCLYIQHCHADGSDWFKEYYLTQGREGLKQKRQTNEAGLLLMDNGQAAPERSHLDGSERTEQYLPAGRTWARHPAPHLDEDALLGTSRSIHAARLITGWREDSTLPGNLGFFAEDTAGCSVLVSKFLYLRGHQE